MKRHRGFTLVEVLVVVGVIALLVAILLPSLALAKKRARTVVCMTNERAFGQTMRMYLQDWSKPFLGGGHGGPLGLWDYQLFGGGVAKTTYYAQNGRRDSIDKFRWCPETPGTAKTVPGSSQLRWNCEQGTGPNSTGSYGFNGWLYDPSDSNARGLAGSTWNSAANYTLSLVRSEASAPTFVDSNWHDLWPLATDAAPASLDNPTSLNVGGGANSLQRACMDRHGMAVNVLFLDVHVETVKLPDLWTLKWSANWNRTTPMKVK